MSNDNEVFFRARLEDAGFIQKWLEGRAAVRAMGREVDGLEKSFQRVSQAARNAQAAQARAGSPGLYGLGPGGAGMFSPRNALPPGWAEYLAQHAQTANQQADKFSGSIATAGAGMARLVAQFAGFGTVIAGVYTLAHQLSAELQRVVSLRMQAAGDVGGYSKALANIQLQMNPGESIEQLRPGIEQTLQMAGVSMEDAPQALAALQDMMSARGNKPSGRQVSKEETLQVWQRVAQIFARTGDWEAASGVGQGFMDIYRAQENTDLDVMTGQTMAAFAQSRTYKAGSFGRHTLPAIGQLMKEGRVPADIAIGLTSAMGFEMADPTGRVTRTAALTSIQRLEELVGAAGVMDFEDIMRFKEKNSWEQIKWIRGEGPYRDRGEREKADLIRAYLLGTRSPDAQDVQTALDYAGHQGWTPRGALQQEVRAESAVVSMLSKSDRLGIAKAVEENSAIARGTSLEEARRRAATFYAGDANDPLAALRRAGMAVEGAETVLRLAQTERAWRGIAMKAVDVLQDATGTSALRKRVAGTIAAVKAGNYSDTQALGMIDEEFAKAEKDLYDAADPVNRYQWILPRSLRKLRNVERFRVGDEAFQRNIYERMTPSQRARIDAVRAARQSLREIGSHFEGGAAPPAAAPAGVLPGQPVIWNENSGQFEPFRPAPPAAPANDDQSALRDAAQALRDAAELLAEREPIRVSIDDGRAALDRRALSIPLALGEIG